MGDAAADHQGAGLSDLLDRVTFKLSPRRAAELEWNRWRRAGRPLARILPRLVRPGDTVLDVGADWGFFTSELSRIAGRTGHVHVFEPNPHNHPSLRRVSAGRTNVVIHPIALSDEAGRQCLRVPVHDGRPVNPMGTLGSPLSATWADVAEIEVETARLDDVPLPQRTIQFAKLDVEGHEDRVLRGGERRILQDTPALLIEIEQRHVHEPITATLDLLSAWGYHGFFLTADGLHPIAEFDVDQHQLRLLDARGEPADFDAYVNDFVFVTDPERLDALRADSG